MAGENSDVPVPSEWELLSMTASTLGLPAEKPEEPKSSTPESEELAQQQKSEESECTQPLPAIVREDLVSAHEDPNRCFSPVDSSKTIVRVSWWKRQVIVGESQSHKYSTVVSIALVAAVVGLAVIGHRWYRERNLNQQLRLELVAKDEKLTDVMQQVKEAMTGRRRIGISKGSVF